MNIDNSQPKISFWEDLTKIDFSNKKNLDNYLSEQWGIPLDIIQNNLLSELSKKIYSYYSEEKNENYATYSLFGTILSEQDIIEKKFKEGKKMGQTYYVLKIGKDKLKAVKDVLSPEKWTQIEKFAILGQNLVFKYKMWITNKELLDFYPQEITEPKLEINNEITAEQSN